jgi:hypothetical protein
MGEQIRMDQLLQGRVPEQMMLMCVQIVMMTNAPFWTSKTEIKPTTQKSL